MKDSHGIEIIITGTLLHQSTCIFVSWFVWGFAKDASVPIYLFKLSKSLVVLYKILKCILVMTCDFGTH